MNTNSVKRDLKVALVFNLIIGGIALSLLLALGLALAASRPAHGQSPTPIPLDTPSTTSAPVVTPIPLATLEPYDNPLKPAWCYGLKWPASKTYPCGFCFWEARPAEIRTAASVDQAQPTEGPQGVTL